MSWLRSPPRLPGYFRRISPLLRNTLLLTLATCILIAGVSFSWPSGPEAVTVFAPSQGGNEEQGSSFLASFLQWLPLDYKEVLSQGLPLFQYERDKGEEVPGVKARSIWEKIVGLLTWIDISDPRSIMMGQVPLLREASFPLSPLPKEQGGQLPSQNREVATVNPTPSPQRPPAKPTEGEPRVAIFHTHASETFIPLHNATHIYDEPSGVVLAGQVLAQELRLKGIQVIHDTTPHDFEVHREAYVNSAKTVAAILEEHPDLDLIIDLHRDAPNASATESRSITTTTVAGREMAGILFMVGTDGLGLEHPNWRENHLLAQRISQQMEQMYPGLSRGVRTSRARYNQHLSPRMILVELGGVENDFDEVARSVECLADVLQAVLFAEQE